MNIQGVYNAFHAKHWKGKTPLQILDWFMIKFAVIYIEAFLLAMIMLSSITIWQSVKEYFRW